MSSPEPLLLTIDLAAAAPAYRQIADSIRAALVSGKLRPGDLLPTVRQLAVDLSVHFNTVAEAYRILAEEGWIDLRRRRGAIVLDRTAPVLHDPGKLKNFSRRLTELAAELRAAGVPGPLIATELRKVAEEIES